MVRFNLIYFINKFFFCIYKNYKIKTAFKQCWFQWNRKDIEFLLFLWWKLNCNWLNLGLIPCLKCWLCNNRNKKSLSGKLGSSTSLSLNQRIKKRCLIMSVSPEAANLSVWYLFWQLLLSTRKPANPSA